MSQPPVKHRTQSGKAERVFVARFMRAGLPHSATPQPVKLTRIPKKREKRYAHLEKVEQHKASEVTAGMTGTSFLQIWERDFYKFGKFLQQDEVDENERANRLLASFPGVVVGVKGGFEFRVTGKPTLAQQEVDPKHGLAVVRLKSVGSDEPEDYEIPLGEFESIIELGAVIRTSATDDSYADFKKGQPYQLKNVEASLRQQIDERQGITLAFVTDYRACFTDDDAKVAKKLGGSTKLKALKRKKKAGTITDAEKADLSKLDKALTSIKNKEFPRQAEQILATLPSFRLEGGQVTIGYHYYSSYAEIGPHCEQVCAAVQELLGFEEPPKVAVLMLYGHGMPYALQIDYRTAKKHSYGYPGSLRLERVPGFVDNIKPYLTHDVAIALYACSNGRAGPVRRPNKDQMFGRVFPCEEVGGDSLAWTIYHELRRKNVVNPTIWAHTTAGHTTRNIRLRVFSSRGTADVPNLLHQQPRLPASFLEGYSRPFAHKKQKGDRRTTRLRNVNLLRELCTLSAWYLPWEWNGGEDVSPDDPDFHQPKHDRTMATYDKIRGLVSPASPLADAVRYEEEGPGPLVTRPRAVITGLVESKDDARLSQHYKFSYFAKLLNPMQPRLSVDLVRKLQLLKYRSGRRSRRKWVFPRLKPVALRHDGAGVAIRVNEQKRSKVLKLAEEMVDQGLFESAMLAGEDILLSSQPDLHAVVSYIFGEMQKNVVSERAQFIQENNEYSLWSLVNWAQLPWDRYEALEAWYQQVRNRGPWDHKPIVRERFGEWAYDEEHRRAYGLDVWSNLHYGYLGRAVGFSGGTLLDGAGFAQARAGTVPDGAWERLLDNVLHVLGALDDPMDQEAIKLGIRMWERHGADLTLEQLLAEVRSRAPGLNTRTY